MTPYKTKWDNPILATCIVLICIREKRVKRIAVSPPIILQSIITIAVKSYSAVFFIYMNVSLFGYCCTEQSLLVQITIRAEEILLYCAGANCTRGFNR